MVLSITVTNLHKVEIILLYRLTVYSIDGVTSTSCRNYITV